MTCRFHLTRRIRSRFLLLALALLLPATAAAQAAVTVEATPAQADRHFPTDEELGVMLRYLVEDGATPGIVLGIRETDGSTRVLHEGTGGPEARPLGPRSVFEIGSINKTFTGTLLADMVARGEVALEDPVAEYLPEGLTVPSWEGREITLLDLATHHSGLPRLAGNHMPADMSNPYADYTVETMYEFLSTHELRREPGTEFEYSNLGMGLLGHALGRAAGTTYRELLRERILEPLGMERTGYALEGELGEWMTTGHDENGEVTSFWFGTDAIDGAGGLRSSVEDMLVYLEANIGPPETDLERAMRDAQQVRKRIDDDQGIGLGWAVREHEGRTLLVHGGGTGGFSTMIGFDPEKGVGFIRLTNTGEFPDDIGLDFLRRGPPLDIAEADVSREVLERYVGRYQAGADAYIPVRLEADGYLTLQTPGNVRFRMHPASDSTFFLKRTPWTIRFLADEEGQVTGLALTTEGVERRARKTSDEPAPAGAAAEPEEASREAPGAGATATASRPAAAAARHFPADEDLQLMLRYLVEDGETPGIVLGILETDGSTRILHYGGAGEGALPLDPKSAFELGSITKAFTGILLADMVERGEVALSDPVSRYMPEGVTIPSRNGREITLLDLATHRSSLPRMPDNMVREEGETYPEYTMEDLHAFLSGHELRRDIGSEYEYSNIAVALLGNALERAAGASYEELLRERILEPLVMRMTSTVVDGELHRWMTRGHGEDGRVAPYRNWPHLPAMGALRSNAEDMLAFLKANVGPPDSRLERVMRKAYEPYATIDEDAAVGLNWLLRKVGDRTFVTHGGGTAGYSTRIAFDPERGVGFVRLANTTDFDDDIALDFLRRGPPLPIPEVEVPAEVLETYVGEYETAPRRSMVVRLESEGWLTMQAPGNVRFRMYADSDSSFFLKRTPWRFTFTKDETGEVVGLVADLEGTERRARKVGDAGPPPAVVAGNAALDLPLTEEEMAPYVGTYTVEVEGRTVELRVFVEDGQIKGQPGGDSPSRLLYQGEHAFIPEVNLGFRLAFTLVDGRAESVTIHDDGEIYRGTREP